VTIKNTHHLKAADFITLAKSAPGKKTYQRLMILAYLKGFMCFKGLQKI